MHFYEIFKIGKKQDLTPLIFKAISQNKERKEIKELFY